LRRNVFFQREAAELDDITGLEKILLDMPSIELAYVGAGHGPSLYVPVILHPLHDHDGMRIDALETDHGYALAFIRNLYLYVRRYMLSTDVEMSTTS
jgi:hypothetical protein